jgi:hypothetical protein
VEIDIKLAFEVNGTNLEVKFAVCFVFVCLEALFPVINPHHCYLSKKKKLILTVVVCMHEPMHVSDDLLSFSFKLLGHLEN